MKLAVKVPGGINREAVSTAPCNKPPPLLRMSMTNVLTSLLCKDSSALVT